MLGLETALSIAFSALCSSSGARSADGQEADDPWTIEPWRVFALLSWAAGGHRPAEADPGYRRPAGHSAHGGPVAPREPTRTSKGVRVFDPAATWTVDPPPAGQSQPQHPLRREELLSAGFATPSCGANRWSSMPRPSVEPGPGTESVSGVEPDNRVTVAPARRPSGRRPAALLVLADGEVFEGEAVGAVPPDGLATGEAVCSTPPSACYQEGPDRTPPYAGQIVVFTYPHIGNYGTNPADDEASRPWCRGIVVRDLAEVPSSWRSVETLEDFLGSAPSSGHQRSRHPTA